MLFEPKGHIPQWEMLYEKVVDFGPGDVITYEQIGEILDRDFDDSARSAWHKTQQVMLRDHNLAFENVRNVGYQATETIRQFRLAKRHIRKGQRSLGRGKAHVEHYDRSAVTSDQAREFDRLNDSLAARVEDARRLARQESWYKDIADGTVVKVERTGEQQAALARRSQGLGGEPNNS